MSEKEPTPAETPPEEDQRVVRIPREVLEASRNDEARELLEYGAEYERRLEEEGLIHP